MPRLALCVLAAVTCWLPATTSSRDPTVVGEIHGRVGTSAPAKLRYRFTATNKDGTPARWNPCSTHAVIVNLEHAPAGALADLRYAVTTVDRDSGLRFRLVGMTSSHPRPDWGTLRVPRRAGAWRSILVGWSDRATQFSGASAETYPVWVRNRAGRLVFVSAAVVFNARQNHLYRGGAVTIGSRRALMEHELGHVVGLDHVRDSTQLMYPLVGDVAGYQAGDRAGLRRLGRGGCLSVPANPAR